MAARKWTPEQRAKQAILIRSWKPWSKSTGAKTPGGKKISSRNAFNFSFRELLRELTRQNRALIHYINGRTPAPVWNETKIDGLLDNLEKSLHIQKCRYEPTSAKKHIKSNQIDTKNRAYDETEEKAL